MLRSSLAPEGRRCYAILAAEAQHVFVAILAGPKDQRCGRIIGRFGYLPPLRSSLIPEGWYCAGRMARWSPHAVLRSSLSRRASAAVASQSMHGPQGLLRSSPVRRAGAARSPEVSTLGDDFVAILASLRGLALLPPLAGHQARLAVAIFASPERASAAWRSPRSRTRRRSCDLHRSRRVGAAPAPNLRPACLPSCNLRRTTSHRTASQAAATRCNPSAPEGQHCS